MNDVEVYENFTLIKILFHIGQFPVFIHLPNDAVEAYRSGTTAHRQEMTSTRGLRFYQPKKQPARNTSSG